jgi:multimeric flavodoxin WrbA
LTKATILGIVCSPRQDGNAEYLLKRALFKAESVDGIETNLEILAGKSIHPCDACDTCHNQNSCHINDDLSPIIEKMKHANAIILSSPVYIQNVCAQAKILIDRTNLMFKDDGKSLLSNKIGAAIVVGQERQGGKGYALWSILNSFLAHHMIIIGGEQPEGYPGVSAWTFGTTGKQDVSKDEIGILAAENLGLRVATLVKALTNR